MVAAKIKEFYDKGGQVIATGVLPTQAAEVGRDKFEVQRAMADTFGVSPDGPLKADVKRAQDRDNLYVFWYFIKKNPAGGRAIFIQQPHPWLLDYVLKQVLPVRDVGFDAAIQGAMTPPRRGLRRSPHLHPQGEGRPRHLLFRQFLAEGNRYEGGLARRSDTDHLESAHGPAGACGVHVRRNCGATNYHRAPDIAFRFFSLLCRRRYAARPLIGATRFDRNRRVASIGKSSKVQRGGIVRSGCVFLLGAALRRRSRSKPKASGDDAALHGHGWPDARPRCPGRVPWRSARRGLRKWQRVEGVEIHRYAPGYVNDWHTASRRQLVITLSGKGEIEVAGGKKIPVGAGHVLIVEDVTGKGHITRVVGTEDRVTMQIPLTGSFPVTALK